MLLLAILVWGLLAIIVGLEANERGRSTVGWALHCGRYSVVVDMAHFGRRSIVGAKHTGRATGATGMGVS